MNKSVLLEKASEDIRFVAGHGKFTADLVPNDAPIFGALLPLVL